MNVRNEVTGDIRYYFSASDGYTANISCAVTESDFSFTNEGGNMATTVGATYGSTPEARVSVGDLFAIFPELAGDDYETYEEFARKVQQAADLVRKEDAYVDLRVRFGLPAIVEPYANEEENNND